MSTDNHRSPRNRRQFLRSLGAGTGALVLAACGSPATNSGSANQGTQANADTSQNPQTATAPAAVASAGQTTITVWFWSDIAQDLVDSFNNSQTAVKAEYVKPGGDAGTKLLTSIAAGAGAPDVAPIEVSNIGSFTAKGGLVNFLDAPYNAGALKDDFVAYKWAQGSTTDGRLIAMPWDIGPAGLWYRADLFEAAGLESDPDKLQAQIKTWDDWIKLGTELRKATPDTALFADSFQDIFYPMVEQQGHGWIDGNKLMIVEKGTAPLQKALEARQQNVDANITWWSPEWSPAIKRNAFASLSVACWMQGGMTREQPETVGQWRVIRAPGGDYNWGGSFLAIPEQSQKKEAAWEFVKYVCATVEGQNTGFKNAGLFPAYTPAWNDPVYDAGVDFYGGQKAYRLYADIAKTIPAVAINPNDRQLTDIVNKERDLVAKENKDPVQAMQDAQQAALQAVPGTTA